MTWLNTPTADPKRKAAVTAQFSQFIRGERVDDCYDVKRVEDQREGRDPFDHQVWALGVRFEPQFKFFGLFLWTDHFVVYSQAISGRSGAITTALAQ